MTKKINAVYILSNFQELNSGCFQVRMNTPFLELMKMGHKIEYVTLGDYSYDEIDNDIVIYSRQYTKDPFRSLWKHKLDGKKIVYDLDDDVWNIPELNPAHETYKTEKHNIAGMCREADLITVSTEALKEKVIENTKAENVVVIPNALNLDKFYVKEKGKDEKLKVAWSGGSNHYEDLLIVLDVIKDLQKEYDFEFVVQGLCGNPWEADAFTTAMLLKKGDLNEDKEKFTKTKLKVYEKFRSLKNFTHIPFYPPEMFPEILSRIGIDIGIIPIKGYEFDKSKSIIKYLEYTAVGAATIASNEPPYTGQVIRTVKNQDNKWFNAIKNLIRDEKKRRELVEEQKKQLFPKYDIKTVVKDYEKVLQSLL